MGAAAASSVADAAGKNSEAPSDRACLSKPRVGWESEIFPPPLPDRVVELSELNYCLRGWIERYIRSVGWRTKSTPAGIVIVTGSKIAKGHWMAETGSWLSKLGGNRSGRESVDRGFRRADIGMTTA